MTERTPAAEQKREPKPPAKPKPPVINPPADHKPTAERKPLTNERVGEGLLASGARIGAYEVSKRIGSGGMGTVYLKELLTENFIRMSLKKYGKLKVPFIKKSLPIKIR